MFIKRIFDLIVASFILLLISPIFLLIMAVLSVTGERVLFYGQERVGKDNRLFKILKFATMLKDSPNIGTKTITVRNDPRVTPVGRILRLTKMNELPQLLNVLRGDMSLVGPRPLLPASFKKYTAEVQAIIYKNYPGVTGIGSLVFRDEEKIVSAVKDRGEDPMAFYKAHIYPYKGQLESWYYQHRSLAVDFMIIVLTAWSLIQKDTQLVYKIFPSLPEKPEELRIEG
jgi:lipopolysaccharide/colanic/teichoic acid biosynthesis glycosyltransferase